MADFAESKKKPKLDEAGLKRHGIVYDARLLSASDWLPPHVDDLRHHLIDFDQRIDIKNRTALEQDFSGFAKVSTDRDYVYSPLPQSDEIFRVYNQLATGDTDYESEEKDLQKTMARSWKATSGFKKMNDDAEAAWTLSLIVGIFKKPYHNASRRHGKLRLFQQWCLEENVLWSAQPNEQQPDVDPKLTRPKPDLTYAFPITRPTDETTPFFSKHDRLPMFSTHFIRELWQRDLKCTLTNKLSRAGDGTLEFAKLRKQDLMGFPWAVVEVKPEDVPASAEKFCFNQAANASAAAVRMYRALIESCPGLRTSHIPPIVGFTCIGPRVRVWLTYFDDTDSKTRMVCIWSANLKTVWGVLSIRIIVENMHIWASEGLSIQLTRVLECLRVVWLCFDRERERGEGGALGVPGGINSSDDNKGRGLPSASFLDDPFGEDENEHSLRTDENREGDRSEHFDLAQEMSASSGEDATSTESSEDRDREGEYLAPAPRASISKRLLNDQMSPGHDSGIESDFAITPDDGNPARTRCHEQVTALDIRLANLQAEPTPTKLPPHRPMARVGKASGSNDDLRPDDRDVVRSTSSPRAVVEGLERDIGSTTSTLTPGTESAVRENVHVTNRDAPQTAANRSKQQSRPSALRTISSKANSAGKRGRAMGKDVMESFIAHNRDQQPGIAAMLARDRDHQRQLKENSVADRTALSDSPVQTPPPGVLDVEQDDDDKAIRSSFSSRRSFFTRRTSSKDVTKQKTASKVSNDAASEVSANSSLAESVKHRVLDTVGDYAARGQAYVDSVDYKGAAATVQGIRRQAEAAGRAKLDAWLKKNSTPSKSVVPDHEAAAMTVKYPSTEDMTEDDEPSSLAEERRDSGNRGVVDAGGVVSTPRAEMPGEWVE